MLPESSAEDPAMNLPLSDIRPGASEASGRVGAKRSARRSMAVLLGVAMLVLSAAPAPAGAQGAGAIVEDFTEERLGAEPPSVSTPTGIWSIGTNGVDTKPVLFDDGTLRPGSHRHNTLLCEAQPLYS